MQQVDQQQAGQPQAAQPQADFTTQITQMNDALGKLNTKITQSETALQADRKALETLQARLAPLAKISAQQEQGVTAAKKDREGAAEAVKKARADLKTARTTLDGQLSDDRQTALQEGIKKFDDEIAAHETTVNDLSQQTDGAKQELATLQSQAKQAEAAVNVALSRQRDLSKEIQAASANTQAVQKALTSAGHDLPKVYVLTVELEKSLAALEAIADAKEGTERTKAVTDAAAAYANALEGSNSKAAEVKDLEEKLKAAQAVLDKARKERQQNIDGLLQPKPTAVKPAV